jgi:hypothetical protein
MIHNPPFNKDLTVRETHGAAEARSVQPTKAARENIAGLFSI